MAINPQQALFLKLYLGRDDRYHGNATQSYFKAFNCESERTAQVCGSRLLKRPEIAAFVKQARDKALAQAEADAAFVLRESLVLYDRSMGYAGIEVDVIDKIVTEEGTEHRLRTLEKRDYNPTIAHKALELIGRHTTVQAFQDNVEHTHTHRLEQKLAQRHRELEARAAQRPAIEGRVIEAGEAGEEAKKRVHRGGGHDRPPGAQEKTTAERAGATGK